MSERIIQEKLLGEVVIGCGFLTAAASVTLSEFQNRRMRFTIYDCPPDRRAIIKDVRMIWNPDAPDATPGGALGSGSESGDDRRMSVKVNLLTVMRANGTDTDLPPAIMFPDMGGAGASSFVMEPGEKLEGTLYINKNDTTGDAKDYIICRVSGVEVLL